MTVNQCVLLPEERDKAHACNYNQPSLSLNTLFYDIVVLAVVICLWVYSITSGVHAFVVNSVVVVSEFTIADSDLKIYHDRHSVCACRQHSS